MSYTLKTLIANIKYAIRNRETVSIGGGLFDATELQTLVDLYNTMNGNCDAGEMCIGCKPIVCPDSLAKD